MVPFWSTIFARPGIVGAASNFIVPPQLRAHGAQTVYFDLYLANRVGTPSKPADPSCVQARADKLFDTAAASSGCAHPADRLERARRREPADAVDADHRAVPRERPRVRAAPRRGGARPFLLMPKRPYTHDESADDWWRSAAQVADLVPEVYFSGARGLEQGAIVGSRHLRGDDAVAASRT